MNTRFPLLAALAAITLLAFDASAQSRVYKPRDLNVPADVNPEKVKDAGNAAVEKLLSEMLGRPDLPKKFAILPLERDVDGEYFTMQLRNTFTRLGGQNGYELYTRNDDQWNNLLQEIQWGDQWGDTMDPATIQKFGRIQGVQAVVVGRISSISKDEKGGPVVRVGLQTFEVETGKQLWGAEERGTADPKAGSGLLSIPQPWLYAAGAVIALLVLLAILRAVGRAARPR